MGTSGLLHASHSRRAPAVVELCLPVSLTVVLDTVGWLLDCWLACGAGDDDDDDDDDDGKDDISAAAQSGAEDG